jgi:hypothetical protein
MLCLYLFLSICARIVSLLETLASCMFSLIWQILVRGSMFNSNGMLSLVKCRWGDNILLVINNLFIMHAHYFSLSVSFDQIHLCCICSLTFCWLDAKLWACTKLIKQLHSSTCVVYYTRSTNGACKAKARDGASRGAGNMASIFLLKEYSYVYFCSINLHSPPPSFLPARFKVSKKNRFFPLACQPVSVCCIVPLTTCACISTCLFSSLLFEQKNTVTLMFHFSNKYHTG